MRVSSMLVFHGSLPGLAQYGRIQCPRNSICVKSEIGLQQLLVDSEHFFRTPYLGDRGWISVWVDRPVGWRLIGDLVRRSYRLVGGGPHGAGQAGLRRSRRPIRRASCGTPHD